jgi:hypothetical protein
LIQDTPWKRNWVGEWQCLVPPKENLKFRRNDYRPLAKESLRNNKKEGVTLAGWQLIEPDDREKSC